MKTVMNLGILLKPENFLTSYWIISFSRRTLIREVSYVVCAETWNIIFYLRFASCDPNFGVSTSSKQTRYGLTLIPACDLGLRPSIWISETFYSCHKCVSFVLSLPACHNRGSCIALFLMLHPQISEGQVSELWVFGTWTLSKMLDITRIPLSKIHSGNGLVLGQHTEPSHLEYSTESPCDFHESELYVTCPMRTAVINQEDSLGKTESRLSEKNICYHWIQNHFFVTYTRLYLYLGFYIVWHLAKTIILPLGLYRSAGIAQFLYSWTTQG
jgi:hypothetical protein